MSEAGERGVYLFSEEGIRSIHKEKLTNELYEEDVKTYLFLIIENNIWEDIYRITSAFRKFYSELKNKNFERTYLKEKISTNMLKLFWNTKDRSTSLHKSLRTLQALFENINLENIDKKSKKSLVNGYLKGIAELQQNSIIPLRRLFFEIIKNYPGIFTEFCLQTDGRSNWVFFFRNFPQVTPGTVIKSFSTDEKYEKMIEDFKKDKNVSLVNKFDYEELGYILGDISRIYSIDAYWLEDTIDNLMSVACFEDYREIRMDLDKFE